MAPRVKRQLDLAYVQGAAIAAFVALIGLHFLPRAGDGIGGFLYGLLVLGAEWVVFGVILTVWFAWRRSDRDGQDEASGN
jgi:hypothetical protein